MWLWLMMNGWAQDGALPDETKPSATAPPAPQPPPPEPLVGEAAPSRGESPALSDNAKTSADLWRDRCARVNGTPFRNRHDRNRAGHRRAYTVCVDLTSGSPLITPSPWNRTTHALAFQRPELVIRSAADGTWELSADGTPAVTGPGAHKGPRVTESTEPRTTVAYLPTFAEGTVGLTVVVDPTSGARVADGLDALIAILARSDWPTAGEWVTRLSRLGAELRTAGPLDRTWVAARVTDIDGLRAAAADPPEAASPAHPFDALKARLLALEGALTQREAPAKATYALQIEGYYNLAFFGGIGLAFGDARDGGWTLVEKPNGAVRLASDGTGPVDPELVIGATYYPGRKPRTYTGFDVGLSAGVGVVGTDDGNLSTFRSLYFGGTFGWVPLSVTIGPMVKTGTHLRNPDREGGKVLEGSKIEDFVEERPGLGFGVMVSLPWSKFQIGKGDTQDLPPSGPPSDGEG